MRTRSRGLYDFNSTTDSAKGSYLGGFQACNAPSLPSSTTKYCRSPPILLISATPHGVACTSKRSLAQIGAEPGSTIVEVARMDGPTTPSVGARFINDDDSADRALAKVGVPGQPFRLPRCLPVADGPVEHLTGEFLPMSPSATSRRHAVLADIVECCTADSGTCVIYVVEVGAAAAAQDEVWRLAADLALLAPSPRPSPVPEPM